MERLVIFALILSVWVSHTGCCGEVASEHCLAAGSCCGVNDEVDTAAESPTRSAQVQQSAAPGPKDIETPVGRVPVIDIGALVSPDLHSTTQWGEAAAAVARACEEWGFFQAVNHGIPEVLLGGVVAKGREMFAKPKSEKANFKRTKTNARGWYDDELTKQTRDWKEGFDVGHVPAPDLPPDHPSNVVAEGYNQWPEDMPEFKETMDAFYYGAAVVAERLLEGVASHFGVPRQYFAPSFEPHTSYLRLNYYPLCPEPCGMLSVNRHTDAGALTVLLQESGSTALQVNYGGTGQWVSIPPVVGALTINVGDMLQVWTNDLFRAPEHRVLSQTDRDRFSAPFFYNPAYHADIAPLPLGPIDSVSGGGRGATNSEQEGGHDGLAGQGAARYRPINWGDFRLKRFAGDYADQGAEVQISQYVLGERQA